MRPLISLFFLYFSGLTSFAFGQNSLIDYAQEAQKAIVGIQAIRPAINNSGPSAVTDPKTGKTIKLSGMQMPYFEQKGAGVIIDPEGYIITNFHTIYLADKVAVMIKNGPTVSGKIIHLMPDDDLALIKIDPPQALTSIQFANSDNIELGEEIINIGHSYFLNGTISGGYIAGVGRMPKPDGTPTSPVELIKVNIKLYKGDSGGPLLNRKGELLGMISAEIRSARKATLVIPSNKIKKLYQDFIK